MRKVMLLLMTLLLILSMAVPASAVGTVTYGENARQFIFEPGTKESPTNLFAEFQNVMPGDSLTQQILIRNSARGVGVRVYLRSKGAQEGTDEFLSYMYLTVTQRGNTLRFQAPPNETAQLTDWVYLGSLYPGGTTSLNLTLDVSPEMDNRFADQVGYLDWEFMVEEFVPSGLPKTGDVFNLMLWSGVMLAALAAVVVLFLAKRKRR